VESVEKIVLVMAGGGLGALCRYGFALGAASILGTRFPWGTLLANMIGCLLIGIAFALSEQTDILNPSARLFFMTGFLGALTTFSTYALETVNHMRAGSHMAAINFLINNLGGGALVMTGFWLVRSILLKGGK